MREGSIIGRRVSITHPGYGNKKPEHQQAVVLSVGVGDDGNFIALVQLDNGDLDTWKADLCSTVPTALDRIVPEWARPHIVEAILGGAIVAAVVCGMVGLAGVL